MEHDENRRWTLAAMHTGVVQNKSIACQADRFLLDGKKEKFSCPIFLLQSNLLLKKRQPMCMAASVNSKNFVSWASSRSTDIVSASQGG
jgi:hypothetical protein